MKNFAKCSKCDCNISTNLSNCPNCGAFLINTEENILAYPQIDHNKLKLKRLIPSLSKLLLVANIIVIIINIFSLWGNEVTLQSFWCLYVIAGSLFLYVCVLYPLSIKDFYWNEVVVQILSTIAFLLLIDLFADTSLTWSLIYVVPIYLGAVTISLGMMMLIRKADSGTILVVTIVLLLLSIVNLILGACIFQGVIENYIIMPGFVTFLTCLFIFGTFALVKFEDLKRMFKRRFHL